MAQWGKQQDAITHYYPMVMLSCFIYEFIYILCNATSKDSVKTIENNEKEEELWLLRIHMTYFGTGNELI